MPRRPFRPEQQPPQLNLPSREVSTANQIQNLLQVVGFMLGALHGPPQLQIFGQEQPASFQPLQKEATIAAENCFVKTCEALEKIVEDPARWGIAFQDKIEKDYQQAMDFNLEYIKAKRDEAVDMASPHMKLNPSLLRCKDGSWLVLLGNPADMVNSIYGAGRSPAEALAAFDEAYRGKIAESTALWAKNQAEIIKNEQSKMDRSGTDQTQEPPKRRRIYPRNSKGTGEDIQSGGASPS